MTPFLSTSNNVQRVKMINFDCVLLGVLFALHTKLS